MAAIPRGAECCWTQELCQRRNMKSKETQNKTKGNEVQKKVQGHRCEVRKAQRQANLTRACLFEAAVASKRHEKF